MKKSLLILTFGSLLISCNPTPNKEERLQKLETEIRLVSEKILLLEKNNEVLYLENSQLKIRLDSLEKY